MVRKDRREFGLGQVLRFRNRWKNGPLGRWPSRARVSKYRLQSPREQVQNLYRHGFAGRGRSELSAAGAPS
jgi:hypothetical protein